jgi:hypothetical protein
MNACGTTNYVPQTQRACTSEKAPAGENPSEERLAMPEQKPAQEANVTEKGFWKIPMLELPMLTAVCPITPVVLDGSLIMLALLVLAFLLFMFRGKSRKLWPMVDFPAIIILLMLLLNYAVCGQLLIMQYVLFVLILIVSLVLQIISSRQKMANVQAEPKQDVGKFYEKIENDDAGSIERGLDRLAHEEISEKPEHETRAVGRVTAKERGKFYGRLDRIDRKLAEEKARHVSVSRHNEEAEDRKIEQELSKFAHQKIAVMVRKPEHIKPLQVKREPVMPVRAVKPVPKSAAKHVQNPAVPSPKPKKMVLKAKDIKEHNRFYSRLKELDRKFEHAKPKRITLKPHRRGKDVEDGLKAIDKTIEELQRRLKKAGRKR